MPINFAILWAIKECWKNGTSCTPTGTDPLLSQESDILVDVTELRIGALFKTTATGEWDLDRTPERRTELRSRAYNLSRHVRALLGPPWKEEELREALTFVLWNGLWHCVRFWCWDELRVQEESSNEPAEAIAPHLLCRAAEIVEFELPLVWLHPVVGSVERRATLHTIFARLSADSGIFVGREVDHRLEGMRGAHARTAESRMPIFVEWVESVIDATESAYATVAQAEALQTAISAAYRQSCRDRRCKSLDETGVMEFRRWIDGIVEAVADLEDTNRGCNEWA